MNAVSGARWTNATKEQLDAALHSFGDERLQGQADPVVPLHQMRAEDFTADGPYDLIVLCRSPGYTPASADGVFEASRDEFLDQLL